MRCSVSSLRARPQQLESLLLAAAASAPDARGREHIHEAAELLWGWLGNLPASRSYYDHEFGAMSFALVSARFAMQFAAATIFSAPSAEARSLMQPQYVTAAGLAAAAGALALPMRYFDVISLRSDLMGATWSPLKQSLTAFASGADYEIRWTTGNAPSPDPRHATFLVSRLCFDLWTRALQSGTVFQDAVGAIMPPPAHSPGDSVLTKCVRQAHLKAVAAYKSSLSLAAVEPIDQALAQKIERVVSMASQGGESQTQSMKATTDLSAANPADTPAPLPSKPGAAKAAIVVPVHLPANSSKPIVAPAVVAASLNEPAWHDQANEWFKHAITSVREDVRKRHKSVKRMAFDEALKVFRVSINVVSTWGASEQKLLAELSRLGLLKARQQGEVHLDWRFGLWLCDGEFDAVGSKAEVVE